MRRTISNCRKVSSHFYPELCDFKWLHLVYSLLYPFASNSPKPRLTLKIEKNCNGQKTILRLIGRLQSEHLDELKEQVEKSKPGIALDFEGLPLVDVEAVRFLNGCEKGGAQLLHCSAYIREWMIREVDREE